MFTNILIAVDGSPCSKRAAQVGLEFARQIRTWISFTRALANGDQSWRSEPSRRSL